MNTRKSSYIDLSDHFCGCGGWPQSADELKIEVKQAANHWKTATDTYSENNPGTDVVLADISNSDPRYFKTTTIATMSPECTANSPAGGNHHKSHKKQMDLFAKKEIDPATIRSRMTMWDVVRFSEYHRYEIVIVENVVESKLKWELFDTWLLAMRNLGYLFEIKYLNSMHFNVPQSRDRMYVVFWKKGNKAPDLNYMPKAFCQKCCKDVHSYQWWKKPTRKFGKYGKYGQYLYRCTECTEVVEPYYHAAFNIIDWSIPGKSVLNRKTPLKPNTIKRIEAGLAQYGYDGYTITTANSSMKAKHATRSLLDPFRTVTTTDSDGIVFPFIVENNGQSKTKRLDQPTPCVTTQIKHGIINPEHLKSFMSYYNGNGGNSHILYPPGTVTTVDRLAVVNYKKPSLEECTYRTIKAHEAKKAMAFRDNYKILGKPKEVIRQLGNAITPPPGTWLLERCVESLTA